MFVGPAHKTGHGCHRLGGHAALVRGQRMIESTGCLCTCRCYYSRKELTFAGISICEVAIEYDRATP